MNKTSYFPLRRLCHSDAFAVILLIVVATALFLPIIMGWWGIFHDDQARESFSRYYFIAYNLQRGIIPLWDPHTWSGAIPFYARYFSDTYYIGLWPFYLLADLNNLTHSYWLLILLPLWLHYILGAVGMFLFLRRVVKCTRFSSYFGAIAYIFSPNFIYAHVWQQVVTLLAWLPWLLLIYVSVVKRWRFWKVALGGLIFNFILTSGQPTYWHFVALLWGVIIIFFIITQLHTGKRNAIKIPLLAAFLIFIIGIGLSSVYLFSFIDGRQYTQEHIELTLSAALNNDEANLPPIYLATLFVPNLFGNITGKNMPNIIPTYKIYFWDANMSGGMAVSLLVVLSLVLALTTPLTSSEDRQKHWWVVVFSGIYLFAVLSALGRYTPFYKYVIGYLPGIKELPFPIRYRMLQCFAVAVLAPIALDYMIIFTISSKIKSHLRRWVWAYIIFSFFVFTAVLMYGNNEIFYKLKYGGVVGKSIFTSIIYWMLVSAGIILGVYYLSPKKFAYFLGVIALIEFIGFGTYAFYGSSFEWHSTAPQDIRTLGPLDNPIVQQVIGPLTTVATDSSLRIATLMPYFDNFVRLKQRFALMGFGMHPLEIRFKRALETAYGRPIGWAFYNDPHRPIHIPFLNNFSVGYFMDDDPKNIFPGGTSIPISAPIKSFVHVNPNALPRAFTLDRVIVASEEAQLAQLVSGDLRQAVYVSSSEAVQLRKFDIDSGKDMVSHFADLQQTNRILQLNLDNPNRIEVDIEINKPAMLVLTEVWYPGWEAFIDNKPTQVYRVNYCQRGVWLEKGKHRVQFRFRPVAWRWGAGISLGTMVLILILTGTTIVKKPFLPKKMPL